MSNDVDSLSETAQEISAFFYTVTGHNILLESDIKTEIVEQLTIFPMPHSPAWCHGMISLRGKIIPVLDLPHMLGKEQNEKARWLLVLESSPLPQIAIRIDQLPARISYDADQITKVDTKKYPNWLTDSVTTEQHTLFKVDHNMLFQQLINENQALHTTQNIETASQQDSSEDDA